MSMVSAVCGKEGSANYGAIRKRLSIGAHPDFVATTKLINPLLFDSILSNRVDVLLQLKIEELTSILLSKLGDREVNLEQLALDLCKSDHIFTKQYKGRHEKKDSEVLDIELSSFQHMLKQLVVSVTRTLKTIIEVEPSLLNCKHTIVYPHELVQPNMLSIQSKFYIVSKQNNDSLVITSIEYSYQSLHKKSKSRDNGWELKVKRFT